ncbi:MAG: hypothetical protein QOG87_4003 [Actinomycetota bacterium]|jgi:hypothetical protein
MARKRAQRGRWAIPFVALGLVAAACTNSGDPAAEKAPERARSRSAAEDHPLQPDTTTGDQTADPATPTTSTANGQTITGRELLQASRARFTRPLPTVAPAVSTPATVPPTTPPTTTPPDGTVPEEPPTVKEMLPSQELIAKALAAGEITWAQSMLYRAYALFWDPRLPQEFDGIGSTGEDDFFTEARLRFAELDADTQAELAPFLERPTSPQGYGCPLTSNGQPVTWQDSGAANPHFKVWACGTGDAANDIAKVVATLDDVYPAMADPAAMGPALTDAGTASDGADPRIDVYLLDVVPTRLRGSVQKPIEGLAAAAISADDPFVGSTASSYLMIGRPRLGNRAGLRRTVIHELFHAQQYAHNYAITTTHPTGTPWFFEASAAWAEWQFFRSASPLVHGDYFTSGFRTAPELPLELPTTAAGSAAQMLHARWAYLWPFFMQQEAGGDPAPVFGTWKAVASATTWNEFHAAVDKQLQSATTFRDFTVRNLNLDLGPGIGTLYRDLDPEFPTGSSPTLNTDSAITQPGTVVQPIGGPEADGLPSLSAQYDQVLVGTQSNTRTLTLDFTGVPKGIDVTVLTRADDGTWSRHDLAPADILTFDFTDPAQVVSTFYVILGNHDREPNWDKPGGATLGGSYSITSAS